jgi:SAM-dependent methyltransferase
VSNIAADYDDKFFQMHVGWRAEYNAMAEILIKHLLGGKSTVIDIGCGNGYIAQKLISRGFRVVGVDGSPVARKYFPQVLIRDLRTPYAHPQRHDLVICTEVAEHLEEKFADTLVQSIIACAKDTIWFSAAVAGNGGHLHLNEQPHEYWHEKFAAKGWIVDEEKTEAIRADLHERVINIWWFEANSYVLRRAQ